MLHIIGPKITCNVFNKIKCRYGNGLSLQVCCFSSKYAVKYIAKSMMILQTKIATLCLGLVHYCDVIYIIALDKNIGCNIWKSKNDLVGIITEKVKVFARNEELLLFFLFHIYYISIEFVTGEIFYTNAMKFKN